MLNIPSKFFDIFLRALKNRLNRNTETSDPELNIDQQLLAMSRDPRISNIHIAISKNQALGFTEGHYELNMILRNLAYCDTYSDGDKHEENSVFVELKNIAIAKNKSNDFIDLGVINDKKITSPRIIIQAITHAIRLKSVKDNIRSLNVHLKNDGMFVHGNYYYMSILTSIADAIDEHLDKIISDEHDFMYINNAEKERKNVDEIPVKEPRFKIGDPIPEAHISLTYDPKSKTKPTNKAVPQKNNSNLSAGVANSTYFSPILTTGLDLPSQDSSSDGGCD